MVTFLVLAALAVVIYFVIQSQKKKSDTGNDALEGVQTPPVTIQIPAEYPSDYFEQKTEKSVIWKLKDKDTQPLASVECVAFSTQELIESPPILVVNVPTIQELFIAIGNEDNIDNAQGLTFEGALSYLKKTGIIHSSFRLNNRSEMINFVKTVAPFMTGAKLYTVPTFVGDCLAGWSGAFVVNHSVLVYGVDENFQCPDGSIGAYRVRWHFDMYGMIDGWFPYKFIDEDELTKKTAYGFRLTD